MLLTLSHPRQETARKTVFRVTCRNLSLSIAFCKLNLHGYIFQTHDGESIEIQFFRNSFCSFDLVWCTLVIYRSHGERRMKSYAQLQMPYFNELNLALQNY